MSKDSEKEIIKARLECWKVAQKALDEMKAKELAALTEEQAARCFDALTWPSDHLWLSPERVESRGLIEQQRLFRQMRNRLKNLNP